MIKMKKKKNSLYYPEEHTYKNLTVGDEKFVCRVTTFKYCGVDRNKVIVSSGCEYF